MEVHMKLRNYRDSDKEYNIGIDAGTGSVGCAVIDDESGDICHFKNKPTWRSRVYPSASTAQDARTYRGQRRRYDRKRQRLILLQSLFAEEIEKVDIDFFNRLNNSFRVQQEREFHHPLFNDSDFRERDYYKDNPTIYHLRKLLMESDQKADIRLIYLAFHNIVKTRGNFLYQDNPSLSAKNADMKKAVEEFCESIADYICNIIGDDNYEIDLKVEKIVECFKDSNARKADKRDNLKKLLNLDKISERKGMSQEIANACLGYVADFTKIFDPDAEKSKFSLASEEDVENYISTLDEELSLFCSLQKVYSSYVLMDILKGANGKTISYSKVAEFEEYKSDLKVLKNVFKKSFSKNEYNDFFRGELYSDGSGYNKEKCKGKANYTKYNLYRDPATRDEFKKNLKKILVPFDQDDNVKRILQRIEEDAFLKRLKTAENGVIPYQLHLEEMDAIIEKQKQYYPFLESEKDKIESLVTFRIPYYVGPLTKKNAAKEKRNGRTRFAWSVRQEGKENERIYPWNLDEIIDKDKSAQEFMNRMIGMCTYLYGEQVLPKCSLKYEMFCVLNELNGTKFSEGDGEYHRFDSATRQSIIDNLFKKRKTVSKESLKNHLKQRGHTCGQINIKGTQAETGFASKLNSYNDFCNILGVDEISDDIKPMVEEIILWCSLFEDKEILERKIRSKYGDGTKLNLSNSQVKKILRKKYSGWGRLSNKLISEIKVETPLGRKSIMDILIEGNPNPSKSCCGGRIGSAMIFNEILHEDSFGFEEEIEKHNKEFAGPKSFTVDDMQGSPPLKRTVKQADKIIKEIVSIAGKPPKNVFIEYTRDDDNEKKGKRTKSRYDTIKSLLSSFSDEDQKVLDELEQRKNSNDLKNEKYFLYFLQNGKCMYSGDPLDINDISKYHVDHIIPQCYIKDDSIDNKVLVKSEENERKSGNLLIDSSIQNRMHQIWASFHNAGLMSDKKYNNLNRKSISDNQSKGFIQRQLVETNQIVKFLKEMLEEEYPKTNVHFVKASVSSGLRDPRVLNLPKSREINDFHHAHDAYLACKVGMFIKKKHPVAYENPIAMTKAVKEFVKDLSNNKNSRKGNIPGSGGFFYHKLYAR